MASEGDEQKVLEKHSENQLLVENADELSPAKVISCSPRKRQRVQGKKICQVCGDKALAHHFGALACETCKAFFRRNAVKPQETRKCVFQGNCCVDKNTRRFCPACRLQKCYHVGMRPELILREEEKQARSKKAKNSIDDGKNVQNKAQVINDLSSQNIDSTSGQTITTSPEHSFWPASPVKQTVLLKSNPPGDCHQERPYFNSTGRSSTHSQHLRFETPADGRHWVQEPSSEGTVNVQTFETGHSVGFNTSLASAPPMSDASTHGNIRSPLF
ncbi:nuclear hormone receptor family member nhr-48-like [Pomacea canaliculata]|uniref:nuclear hormone receptor family member nhr-48-like n=1 Tax=Pomacea canaliculata TaxID=400727 RepID=UPI000D73842A|nr:nuclear hormone receptor family member nhr-48-like [Pomacea canaliculata]XP_025096041.1 nuclear hormone receptor family member nhr-48-like [Pomacea canaliculata]XP_025096042.1 nuclear hormone receptor family member nhr-48-like [Pomacea canaliculata]